MGTTTRSPCVCLAARSVDLLVYDGGGFVRSVGVWRLTGRTLRIVTAGDA